jgi:hypothetical protein
MNPFALIDRAYSDTHWMKEPVRYQVCCPRPSASVVDASSKFPT